MSIREILESSVSYLIGVQEKGEYKDVFGVLKLTLQGLSSEYGSGDPAMDLLLASSAIALFSLLLSLLLPLLGRRGADAGHAPDDRIHVLEMMLADQKSAVARNAIELKAEFSSLRQELHDLRTLFANRAESDEVEEAVARSLVHVDAATREALDAQRGAGRIRDLVERLRR